MMNVGWVKYYFYYYVVYQCNMFFIVGYCVFYIFGGWLCDGVKEVWVFGQECFVNVDIEVMDLFFVYVDWYEILDFLWN